MNFNFDVLLSSDDRYKLLIYQVLQAKREVDTAIVELKQQISLSDFKFNHLLQELKQDLIDTESIMIINDKYLHTEHFSYHDYQILQLMYFKRSVSVEFLIKVGLFESITIAEFAEYNFLSSSSVYNVQSDVNRVLDIYGLSFKNSQIIGDEKSIRSVYFQVLFNYYGGIESPFPEYITRMIDSYINSIEKSFIHKLTNVQRTKLEMFLGIQLYRIQNNCFIDQRLNDDCQEIDAFFHEYAPRYSSKKIPQAEGANLFLYLVLNGYMASNIKLPQSTFGRMFLEYLDKKINISEYTSYPEIAAVVENTAQCWLRFQLATTTFIDLEEFDNFAKENPRMHSLIYEFVSQLGIIDGHLTAESEKTHLYYEFMVILSGFTEIQHYEKSINIFTDFSSGKNYNQFISDNIKYNGFLNVNIVNSLTAQTDIYISDFSNSKVKCLQVIWKGHPNDNDWEVLNNAIITLRNRKNK